MLPDVRGNASFYPVDFSQALPSIHTYSHPVEIYLDEVGTHPGLPARESTLFRLLFYEPMQK